MDRGVERNDEEAIFRLRKATTPGNVYAQQGARLAREEKGRV